MKQNVFNQSKTEIGIGIGFSLLCAGLIWTQTQQSEILTWLLIIITIYAFRYGISDYISRLHSANKNNLGNTILLMVGLILCGLAWASLIINTPFKTGDAPLNILALGVAGALSFILLIVYLGRNEFVLSFAITSLLVPLAAIHNNLDAHIITIAFILIWIACLMYGGFKISNQIASASAKKIDSINEAALKQQNDKLTSQLAVAQAKVEELSSSLKLQSIDLETTQNKADALSITLNQINPFDLESGLLTEVKLKTILQREWARMGRLDLPITLVYLSIDDFEQYSKSNDKKAYSMTFKRVIKIVKKVCQRPADVFAKISEDQIGILLPETDLESAKKLAQKIRSSVEALTIKQVEEANHEFITVSLGIATVIPNDLLTEGVFLKRADSALYEAKFQGGNRAAIYVSHPEIKLESWDEAREGKINADKLKKKLTDMGFETESKTYLAGQDIKDRRTHAEFVFGVLTGNLLILIDGDTIQLTSGDILILPKSLNIICKVKGSEPVICYEGNH